MHRSEEKLKILFITSDRYPPFRPAARAIFGEEMVKRGHIIDWILRAERSCHEPLKICSENGTLYIGATDDGESRFRRLRKYLLDFINDLRMFRLIKENDYDLIQVKDKYISAVIAIIIAKLSGVKYFYWLAYPHAEASIYEARKDIARYPTFYLLRGHFSKFVLYHIILPAADHVFVQSAQMKKDIVQEGIPEDKMTSVPTSVDLSAIPYRVKTTGAPSALENEEPRIIYVGTLARARHLDFLIRVMSKVLQQQEKAKLYLVGKGEMPEDEEFLKAEIKQSGIEDSVVFTGYLPMKKVWAYIRTADVCVSPYYPSFILNSTSPTKLIEYLAMGKAVVANDHPEQKLVISKCGAGIISPWEEDAFAKAIIKLLTSPESASEMGIKGRRYVERYRTNRKMADIIEKEYFRFCR